MLGRGAFGTGDDAGGWDDTPYRSSISSSPTDRRRRCRPARSSSSSSRTGCSRRIELAQEAAGDRYVTIGGGADVARQFLAAGLVDELQLHVVPMLLGEGIPLFGGESGAGRLVR